MKTSTSRSVRFVAAILVLGCLAASAAGFRVATYNVENYLIKPTETRQVKPPESKAKVQETLAVMDADVVALQEMGDTAALEELRKDLEKLRLGYPQYEHVAGSDTNVHVAVLSRLPIVARRSHTNESFLLNGRRFRVSRGFAEVDIKIDDRHSITVFTTHLKSKRAVPEADEAELRLEEAKLLRAKIDARLAADPDANIIVMGDFNDTKDSPSTRVVIGRGKGKLVDLRPAETNGDDAPAERPDWDPAHITWTHFYGKEDSYSRIDYILTTPGLAKYLVRAKTFIIGMSNWGVASDHRALVATFDFKD
jgi:endonuclease/exonuclease/phosphatase family metal-dependent hydrolase